MPKQYDVKVFKSGNSVALRLPKALGLVDGDRMVLREEQGKYSFEPADAPKRKFNIDKVWGICKDLELIKPEDRVFEEVPRVWDDADWPGWAGEPK